MRFNAKRLTWIIVSIALLITLYFVIGYYQTINNLVISSEGTVISRYETIDDPDTAIINYKKLSETLKNAERNYREAKFNFDKYTKDFGSGNQAFMGPLGIARYYDADTSAPFSKVKTKFIAQKRYYLILNHYTTKIEKYKLEDRVYYGLYGKFYKKELLDDSVTKKTYWKTSSVNYLPVFTENESQYTSKQPTGHILIPISKEIYDFLNILSWVLAIILLIIILHLIVGNIIKVAIAISKGKAFIYDNYYWLLQAGISLLSITMIGFLAHVIPYLCFKYRLDAEWKPDIDWLTLLGYLSISTFVILLAFAFKKGTRMQAEQDLTI